MMEQDPRKMPCATPAQGANLIGGSWVPGAGPQARDIRNPADTDECLAEVREASSDQVNEACARAAGAFPGWRATPAPEQARVLFRYRQLLEEHFDDLVRLLVCENGKLLSEARGSLRRGVEAVNVTLPPRTN